MSLAMSEAPAPSCPVGMNGFLGGRLRLRQPTSGHRCGTDAILLAAAAPRDLSGLAVDAGAGVGGAGMALAVQRPNIRIALLEKDPFLSALARENLAENGLLHRGFVSEADLLSASSRAEAGLGDGSAALVISNPPFLDPARARLSPNVNKRMAHGMAAPGSAALSSWIKAMLAMAAQGGLAILIHRPEALPIILETLSNRAGAVTVLPVHPRPFIPASRILVRARKGSHAPLAIAPPLFLHDGDQFTREAEALHRGEALIDW